MSLDQEIVQASDFEILVPDGLGTSSPTAMEVSSTFDLFGVLEHILWFVDTETLKSATMVNRRWKEAGRNDGLWKAATLRLWKDKKGVRWVKEPLFWRTLFTKNAVERMSMVQIQAFFDHPFLLSAEKKATMSSYTDKMELQRALQVHMLDIMSEGSDWNRFFSDLYFGSFVSSILDSRRETISQAELCTKHGYDMYFKVLEDEVDEQDRGALEKYDEGENILLYHHSKCYFEESRDFRIVLSQAVHSYHPIDLKWGWLEMGHRLQVGPYPSLTVSRRKDWGWKLENTHVVLFFRDD